MTSPVVINLARATERLCELRNKFSDELSLQSGNIKRHENFRDLKILI